MARQGQLPAVVAPQLRVQHRQVVGRVTDHQWHRAVPQASELLSDVTYHLRGRGALASRALRAHAVHRLGLRRDLHAWVSQPLLLVRHPLVRCDPDQGRRDDPVGGDVNARGLKIQGQPLAVHPAAHARSSVSLVLPCRAAINYPGVKRQ